MPLRTEMLTNGIGLIEVKGTLLTEEEIVALRAAVSGFVDRRWRKLIIDLSSLTYVNSTAIGVLVSAHTTYSKKEWQLKFCNVNKHISAIFAITKLTHVFSIYETREEAIKSIT